MPILVPDPEPGPPEEPQEQEPETSTWVLQFPTGSLDERIEMRGLLARLRAAPEVRSVRQDGPRWVVEVVGDPGREIQRIQEQYASWRQEPLERLSMGGSVPYEPNPTPPRSTPEISEEIRRSILEQYLRSTDGRSRLAQSMIAPIRDRLNFARLERHALPPALAMPLRTRRDYQAVGRRTFLVEELPQGALPVYDRDPDVAQTAIGPGTLREAFEQISQVGLRPSTMIMSEADFRDLQAWSEGTSVPVFLPDWAVPGQWIYTARFDRYAKIETLESSKQAALVENWRFLPEHVILTAVDIHQNWKPCDPPREPRHRLDRVMEEDFLADLDGKTRAIRLDIEGDDEHPMFIAKFKQAIKNIWTHGLNQVTSIVTGDSELEMWQAKSRFNRPDPFE